MNHCREIFLKHLEIINPVWFTKSLSPSELCIHNNDLQIYQTYFESKVEVVKFITFLRVIAFFKEVKQNICIVFLAGFYRIYD